jgi:hypothetical protein
MKKLIITFLLFVSVQAYFSQTTFSCSGASTVCSCGSGATGQYYAGYFNDVQTYFTTNTVGLTRNDATINFATDNGWGAIVPPAGGSLANPETYSTRWYGRIYLAAGTYTFWLTSDDASYLWLGSNALAANPTTATSFINNGGLHSPATVAAVAIFTSNCLQDFKIHFGENGGNNRAVLEYGSTGLSIARQVVPTAALCACMSSGPLPINLTSFYAEPTKENVALVWKTATEQNNKLFTLYKSSDAQNWTVLGETPGSGTSSERKEYKMVDENPFKGINYYYLMQTDNDGTTKKFPLIYYDYNDNENYLKVFPNPFKDKITLISSAEFDNLSGVQVFDALQKQIQLPMHQISSSELELNTGNLERGFYTLKITTAYRTIIKKIVKS